MPSDCVSDSDFADEIDLIGDYTLDDAVSLSAVGAVAIPDDGATQYTGDEDWYYAMLYARVAY
jgi:hypothetical protein